MIEDKLCLAAEVGTGRKCRSEEDFCLGLAGGEKRQRFSRSKSFLLNFGMLEKFPYKREFPSFNSHK
jgi:hypothetical protein